jgi:hypothetical protein
MRRFHLVGLAMATLLLVLPGTGRAAGQAASEWQRVDLLQQAPTHLEQVPQVAFGNGRFVAVSSLRPYSVFVSADGAAWKEVEWERTHTSVTDVVFARGKFLVTAGSFYGTELYSSRDGEAWERTFVPGDLSGSLSRVVYGNGRFAAGFEGRIGAAGLFASKDGVEWGSVYGSPFQPPARMWWDPIAYGNGRFIVVAPHRFPQGREGAPVRQPAALVSTDGVTYDQSASPDNAVLTGIAYGRGRFVAVGEGGAIYTTQDGRDWTRRASGTNASLTHVEYTLGRFQALDADGIAYTSSDGDTWAPDTAGVITAISRAIGNGKVVTAQPDGSLRVASMCSGRFADVADSAPSCMAVELLSDSQVVAGFPDGRFHPERTLTRAELAKMVVVALKAERSGDLPFSDVAGHWSAEQGYLQKARSLQVLDGFPDGTFHPDEPLTRAQLVKVVAAAIGMQPAGAVTYADVTGTEWYAGWLGAATRAGLVGEDAPYPVWTGDQFEQARTVMREEAALVISNMLEWR